MADIEDRLNKLDERLDAINFELGKLIGEQHTVQQLIKYVILPLLVIMGALVGVDLTIQP